jgi:hypothetical protein
MASRCTSTLFEGGCCAGSERLNKIMNAAASNVVERRGGRVKVEIAVFIAELLGARNQNARGSIEESLRRPRVLYFIEYCQEQTRKFQERMRFRDCTELDALYNLAVKHEENSKVFGVEPR